MHQELPKRVAKEFWVRVDAPKVMSEGRIREQTKGNFRMGKLSPARRLLKIFHPEGIPWPGTAFYNAISETHVFRRHYEWISRDILSYCSEGSILDIGTGPGWLLVKLHQQSPRLRLLGLDISPSMVAKARKNITTAGLSDVIEIKEGRASNLPFADSSFDIVVSTGSIHHWKELTASLNEIHRVLKPRGYALMYDLVSNTPAPVLEEMAHEFGRLRMLFLWLHGFEEPFYSRENFESLARPTLFKEGQTRFVGVTYCLILKKRAGSI
jgi:ubiquinone/menaquinone biosynthesis C-methylase UbiE